MTLAALISADVDNVFLQTNECAETVTREIEGDTTDTQSQTAIVDSTEVSLDLTKGRAFAYDYVMHLNDAVTVLTSDTYLIGSLRCRVLRIADIEAGMQSVWLQRIDTVRTESHSVRFLR